MKGESEEIIVEGYPQDAGELPGEKLKKQSLFAKIPPTLLVWFINFWFGGAIYFFIGWGIFTLPIGEWLIAVVLGLCYGLIGDVIINTLFTAMLGKRGMVNRHIFFHSKRFYSIFINCAYGVAIALLITLFYAAVNLIAIAAGHPTDKIFLGAEPIITGMLYATINLLFVLAKNWLVRLFKKEG